MTEREVANEDENEYSDPDTAAEQVPRVLFGRSAHSRQKRTPHPSTRKPRAPGTPGREWGPESAAKLRTSRDGDSEGGGIFERGEENRLSILILPA